MDEQFQDGFERMLADMPDGPTWEQVSSHQVITKPVPTRSRGMLIAAAAFIVTIVVVGAVVLVFDGGPDPVAPVAAATVDHVEISWAQNVELRCVGMEKVDNGGYEIAKIEIWGPNTDGFVRVDATAPDGTVERVITTHAPDRGSGRQVWSSPGLDRGDTVFRVAGCSTETPDGSSHYSMSDPPISPSGHRFGAFISIPTHLPNGSPFNLEAGQAVGEPIGDDVWRGVPVKVFMNSAAGIDELGAYGSNSEIWVDVIGRRYEVARYLSDHEVLGTVVTSIEAMERGTVPTDSVSFSTEGLNLTLDIPPMSSGDTASVTTTSTTAPDTVDAATFDDVASIDAEINRRRSMVAEAQQKMRDAEEAIQRNKEILKSLEAQTNPTASQVEIDRQRLIVRVSELQKEHLEEIVRRNEAIVAVLQAHREALMAAERDAAAAGAKLQAARLAAESRAARDAPYVVEEPVELTPPPPFPGGDLASGSGCPVGTDDLLDGIWFGYLIERDGLSITFNPACMYFGQIAWEKAAAVGQEANGDVWFVDDDGAVVTLPVSADATAWAITGDATEGHQSLSFATGWTGAESMYGACPGEECPVWIYVNSGVVDAIVEQYLP